METGTEWRAIPGYEGWYEVSNRGDVRRIARGPNAKVGQILKATVGSHGYLTVSLQRHKRRSPTIHSLVAAAFLGPRPPGLVINHKDSDRHNNHVHNLEYVTQGQNVQHAWDNGRMKPTQNAKDIIKHRKSWPKGEDVPVAKLTEEQARAILSSTEPGIVLAARYGVTKSAISRIKHGKTWRHLAAEGMSNACPSPETMPNG